MSKNNNHDKNNLSGFSEPTKPLDTNDNVSSMNPIEQALQAAKVETPVKPQTSSKVEHVVITKKTVLPKQAPRSEVDQFNDLSSKYISIMKHGITSQDVKKNGIIQLEKLLRFVMLSKKTEVFEACLKFFMINRNLMMQQTSVLSGMIKYVASNRIDDLVKLYILFYSLVESRIMHTKFPLNIKHIKTQFNNIELANWVSVKK